jgi:hypothetical protein
MTQQILFGGSAPLTSPDTALSWPPEGDDATEILFQEFCHFLAKIWLRDNHRATLDPQNISEVALTSAIEEYRIYRSAGHDIHLDEGLDLEQNYLVAQIVASMPLVCLLNKTMPFAPSPRITRIRHLSVTELTDEVNRRCSMEFDTARNMIAQIMNMREQAPGIPALLFDGVAGHCIMLRGKERGSGRLVCWDPIGMRSFLCPGNNRIGVAAQLVPSGEYFWTLPIFDLIRMLYGIFVPLEQ